MPTKQTTNGSGCRGVTNHSDVFLSYSRNDGEAAINLRGQLHRRDLSVFKDDERIGAGELWLNRLQEAVGACSAFVVLVGRDGVRRWVGAETQVALNRYFAPHDDTERLPIFPILLEGTEAETLPAFLRLFQMTPWNGADALPERLLDDIRHRTILTSKAAAFEGCPFVGLAAFRIDQAHLFFGRQKETLDALACFDTRRGAADVRWLEINGNSGSGKSSLMQAGLLPLVDEGWMWPRTGFEHWQRIGPIMPGARPVEMLAEHLARTFSAKMGQVVRDLQEGDEALRYLLRERKKDETAFLLAIDQFEELFTSADPNERRRFDVQLAAALEDPDCPLFVISTVRADFLERFGEDLPRLVAARNRLARPWTLAPIGVKGLREVIEGPARLAGLDVSEIEEAMVAEARDEPGALPLVENALHWLWEKRTGNRLVGQLFTHQGGLAGILSGSADGLLSGLDKEQRARALELLLRLVQVDPEARRHTRRRIPLAEAIDVAGGGERGRGLVDRLAGQRRSGGGAAEGPLRLIAVTEEAGKDKVAKGEGRWVNMIHEMLIRSKGLDAVGKPQPYWPTLWDYIEQNKGRAAWLRRIEEDTQIWIKNGRRTSDLWSRERVREFVAAFRQVAADFRLSPDQQDFLGPVNSNALLAELQKPGTTHGRRLLIGERLDVLMDPRRGVGIDALGTPEIDWCEVDGGTVTVEFRGHRPELGVIGRLARDLKPFQIARYPVTVKQYRAFLMAEDGWRDPAWWQNLYRDPEGNTYQFGRFDNHPAVYVSGFDAMAFCHWLSRRSGLTIRLPDEWEWQHAATGGDCKNLFPWGVGWLSIPDPHRANMFDSRLGAATAVGMYPAGATRQGVYDIIGTVLEWCIDNYHSPGHPRILRGGSWNVNFDPLPSAYRQGASPLKRDADIGFRVVCSSLS